MKSAARTADHGFAGGVGELDVAAADAVQNPPNPNRGLERFLVGDPNGGSLPVFDSTSWLDAAKADTSWDSTSWTDTSWLDTSWTDTSWTDTSWMDTSWADTSWTDLSSSDTSWADTSWQDTSWEDAAEADANDTGGYLLGADDLALVEDDPGALTP
jgi:hypothetical protein